MKNLKFLPLFTKHYTLQQVKNNQLQNVEYRYMQFTNHASWSLKMSPVEVIAPQLEVIAKQHNINIMDYGQFEYAFDLLRFSVSWN